METPFVEQGVGLGWPENDNFCVSKPMPVLPHVRRPVYWPRAFPIDRAGAGCRYDRLRPKQCAAKLRSAEPRFCLWYPCHPRGLIHMDLVELIITVCAIAAPMNCHEDHLQFTWHGSLQQCAMGLRPILRNGSASIRNGAPCAGVANIRIRATRQIAARHCEATAGRRRPMRQRNATCCSRVNPCRRSRTPRSP